MIFIADEQETRKNCTEDFAASDFFVVTDVFNTLIFMECYGCFFKLKDYDKSITLLQRAYALERHPEIAAHLGEALWAQGREVEAKSVWASALDQFPDNDALLETVERYGMD